MGARLLSGVLPPARRPFSTLPSLSAWRGVAGEREIFRFSHYSVLFCPAVDLAVLLIDDPVSVASAEVQCR